MYFFKKVGFMSLFLLQESSQGPVTAKPSTLSEYVVVGTLDDRSILSDEMADMCAKLPIYRVMKKSLTVEAEKQRK